MKGRAAASAAFVTAASTAVALAEEGGSESGASVQKEIFEVAAPGPDGELAVDNRLGDVLIEGTAERKSAEVVAVKRAPSAEAMDRIRLALRPEDGSIHIATAIAGRRSADLNAAGGTGREGEGERPDSIAPAGEVGVDLVIRVPPRTRPLVEVWNGRIEVRNLDEGARLSANQGRIEVGNVTGPVAAKLAQGEQSYRVVLGSLDAEGISGDIAIKSMRGEHLGISLHEGKVRARDVRAESVSIVTALGDVRFRGSPPPGGDMRIASYRGDLDVRLETSAPLIVAAASRAELEVGGDALRGGFRAAPGRYLGAVSKAGDSAAIELSSRVGRVRFAIVSR